MYKLHKMADFWSKSGPLYTGYRADKSPEGYGSKVQFASGSSGYRGTNDPESWRQEADRKSWLDYEYEKARAERIREFTKQQVLNDYNEAPGWWGRKWQGFKEGLADIFVPDRFRTAYRFEGDPVYLDFKNNLTKAKARKTSADQKMIDAEYLANKNYEWAMNRARAVRAQKFNQVLSDKTHPRKTKGWLRQALEDIRNFYK